MRVLLISINRETFVHRVAPIGLLHLAGALEQDGHVVRVVDFMFARTPDRDVERAVAAFRPDLVGVAIRNLDSLIGKDTYRVPEVEACMRTLRRCTGAPVVLGGPGYSLFPELLAEHLGADWGIAGEADRSFPALVSRLERKEPVTDLPGLVWRDGGRFTGNPPDIVQDVDAIPFQAVRHVDARRYARNRGNLGIFTRKACPFDCIYCPEAYLHGHALRLRSAERVVDEIAYIVKTTGVVDFDFADTTFNVPRSHAVAVCEEIVRRNLKIRFEVELNPVDQDEDTVRLLQAAGCIGVDLTADSGSDRMLTTLRRGFRADDVDRVARIYQKLGVVYTVGFLLGGPGEDLQSVEETIALARNLPGMGSCYFTLGIRLLPHTDLLPIAQAEGYVAMDEDLFRPVFYVSPTFDARCADRLLQACQENLRLYISDVFFTRTQRAFLAMADRGNVRPLWKNGAIPKIVDRIQHLGRPSLRWDDTRRRFVG